MIKNYVLIYFMILFPSLSNAKTGDDSLVWGRVVVPEKTLKGISYQYFIYYEKDGKSYAYPLETNKKDIAEIIKKNVNQNVRIQGTIKETTLNIDGPKQRVLVFVPNKVKPLTLSELSIQEPVDMASSKPTMPDSKKEEYSGGGIRISDKAANLMIYTGAAVILGSQIGKFFVKKD